MLTIHTSRQKDLEDGTEGGNWGTEGRATRLLPLTVYPEDRRHLYPANFKTWQKGFRFKSRIYRDPLPQAGRLLIRI